MEGAEPLFLLGGDCGILLIHGFTGSPAEMGLLGEFLHKKGYTILAPRLSGHGTTVEDMVNTEWSHWYSSVEDAYHILKAVCSRIVVVGLSMGGLLALKLSTEYTVDKVISLSAPIFIADKRLNLLPIYRMFRRFVPKRRKVYKDIPKQYTVCYNLTPLRSLSSLLVLLKQVDTLLPSVTVPTLIIQGKHDHTVEPRSAEHIYNKVGSAEKKIIWLNKSGHIVTIDIEHERVFQHIAEFLEA